MILTTSASTKISNPTPDDIRKVLENYECSNNIVTQATIESNDITLVIEYDKKYGYYILELNEYKAPLGDKQDKSLLVVHDMGGDPFLIPLCCHLDSRQAEKILLHFMRYDGELLDYPSWYDIYEGQSEGFIDNELYNDCKFGEMLKIRDGSVAKL